MSRIRLTTYTAGAIEHVSNSEMKTWRQEFAEKLKHPDLLIYDPVEQESSKVGKESGKQVEYIKGLKKAGQWSRFYDEMNKIWFGTINIDNNTKLIDLFTYLRNKKLVDGNKREEIDSWGDYEAVVRSDFIVVYMPKDVKTIGTIYEVLIASLFHIPIYLVLPDQTKTDANSSLIHGVMISGGEVFYSINDTIKRIKEKYQL